MDQIDQRSKIITIQTTLFPTLFVQTNAQQTTHTMAADGDLTGLKQRIDKLLRETNTYSQIRDFIRHQQDTTEGAKKIEQGEGATTSSSSSRVTVPGAHGSVAHALKEKHVLSQLVRSLRRPPNLADHGSHQIEHSTSGLSSMSTPSPFRRFLLLKIRGGRAFVDHASSSGSGSGSNGGTFVLHLHFRNQRFRSRPVPCCLEPEFDESFLMDLQPTDSTELVDLGEFL